MNRWTKLVHQTSDVVDAYAANSTPIYQTATFAQATLTNANRFDYSRSGNPTRSVLENQLANLESAQYAFTFNTGIAAINAVTQLLNQGDHIIFGNDIYGGTHRLLTQLVSARGIQTTQIDTTDIQAFKNAITPATKLVLIETPSNPLLLITDIQQLADLLHEKKIKLAVDNTLLSPWLQQPLQLGADIVIHSATKHLAGHSDLTAGVVAVNDGQIAEKIAFIQNATGCALAPFPAWLLLRGIKTLGLRLERQQATATIIADFLSSKSAIKQVYYPGLSNHPNYDLHQKQAQGPGTVISFTTGNIEKSQHIVAQTKLCKISVSFGSLVSLISLPYHMSHASIRHALQQLPEDLIRLSIGIKEPIDLCNDLDQCLSNTKTNLN